MSAWNDENRAWRRERGRSAARAGGLVYVTGRTWLRWEAGDVEIPLASGQRAGGGTRAVRPVVYPIGPNVGRPLASYRASARSASSSR